MKTCLAATLVALASAALADESQHSHDRPQPRPKAATRPGVSTVDGLWDAWAAREKVQKVEWLEAPMVRVVPLPARAVEIDKTRNPLLDAPGRGYREQRASRRP